MIVRRWGLRYPGNSSLNFISSESNEIRLKIMGDEHWR